MKEKHEYKEINRGEVADKINKLDEVLTKFEHVYKGLEVLAEEADHFELTAQQVKTLSVVLNKIDMKVFELVHEIEDKIYEKRS